MNDLHFYLLFDRWVFLVQIHFSKNGNWFLSVYLGTCISFAIYCWEANNFIFFIFVILQISKELSIGGIFQIFISRLRKRHHLNVDVRKRGLIFTKCIVYESFKDLISKLGKNNNEAIEYEAKLKKHILHQESCRNLYHTWKIKLVWSKDEFLCIIHDKMDHAKNAF